MYNRFFYISLFYLTFLYPVISEVLRPRGVSLSRASLYNPEKDFTCLDGSLTIPFTQVNDDYCDCPDASDEPGTSACPHGIFHCTNAGHKPLNLPSSRVNDGICDCCDASDEYASNASKHVKCINNCLELGRSAREEAQRKADLIRAGKQLRAELSQQGIQLKEDKRDKLADLHKRRTEAEKIKIEKEQLKKDAESLEGSALEKYRKIEEEEKRKRDEEDAAKNRAEALETFDKFDSNKDGKIELSEIQTRQSFDKDRNGEVSEDEARYFLNGEDAVDQEKFVTDSWQNIKPYLMMDSGLFKPPGEGEAVEEEIDEEQEADDHQEGEEEEEDHEEIAEEQQADIASASQYDQETQKLVEQATAARNQYNEAEKSVRDIQSEINNIEEYLQLDFGPDEEFATLREQCFEYTDHEYIYKLCPFEKTVQQPKSSTVETRLGVWGSWVGPDENRYEVMLYDKGQSCWNGPQRSTRVQVSCGSENKITSVSEPNRCEYLFDFITPAACREITSRNEDDVHDEL